MEIPNLVWDSRVQITKTLAGYVKQLRSFKIPLMGNLYPSSRPEFERVAWLKDLLSGTRFVSLSDNAEFAMAPWRVFHSFLEIVSVYKMAPACSKCPRVT